MYTMYPNRPPSYPHFSVRPAPDRLTPSQPDPRAAADFLAATCTHLLACYNGQHDPEGLLNGQCALRLLSGYYLGNDDRLQDALLDDWRREHQTIR